MYNRKAFKREAKQLMREARPHYMLVALVYFLLTAGLTYVVTALTGAGTALGGTLSVFLNILVGLLGLVLSVGLAGYALRLSRGEQAGVRTLFDGFAFAGRAIGMNILVAIYTFLWMLLIMVCFGVVIGVAAAFLFDTVPVLGGIIVGVAYIVLLVFVVRIALRYAMANFALAENPDAGASAAIRRSVKIMRGNKGKLFVMQLSFIGWQLLLGLIGAVVLVVGVVVGGTSWMFQELFTAGEDLTGMFTMLESLLGHMTLWSILAEIVCWPLSMWLTVYMQTAYAKFYDYAGGVAAVEPVQAMPLNEAAPVEAAPVEAAPVEEAPAEAASVEETPAEETPAEETPAEETPAEETPAEETPVQVPAAAVVQSPVGGYYTPAPILEEPAPEQEEETPEEPEEI